MISYTSFSYIEDLSMETAFLCISLLRNRTCSSLVIVTPNASFPVSRVGYNVTSDRSLSLLIVPSILIGACATDSIYNVYVRDCLPVSVPYPSVIYLTTN